MQSIKTILNETINAEKAIVYKYTKDICIFGRGITMRSFKKITVRQHATLQHITPEVLFTKMLKHMVVIAVTGIVMLSFCTSAFTADPLGGLTVVVKDFYTEEPVSGADILVTPCNLTAVTDESGTARIEDVVPFRNYQVDAEAEGYTSRSTGFVVAGPGTETVVTLPVKKTVTITGTVGTPFLFDWLLLPVWNAVVIMGRIEEGYWGEYFATVKAVKTDFFGSYTLNDVEEDSYVIIAVAEGFYASEKAALTLNAGESVVQNFSIAWEPQAEKQSALIDLTDLAGEQIELPTVNGKRIVLDGSGNTEAAEFYWIKDVEPEGAVPMGTEYWQGTPPGQKYTYIVPAAGDYTVRLFTVDAEGLVRSGTAGYSAADVAPVAVPSVIPGPSELPYLYDDQVYVNTQGTESVEAGETVYLRGFAVDENLLSPEEFNPDAPCFDIYGIKNGNFSASIFGYTWTLKDGDGNDVTSLLMPGDTSENVNFTIPDGTGTGSSYTATLTVTDNLGTRSDPEELLITVAERVDDLSCTVCHSENAAGHALTKHALVSGGAGCQDCHGPGSEHVAGGGSPRLTVSNWPGVCGQCHDEFAQLQKANHSDSLPFGYYEPTEGRLTTCYKCHYTSGYIGAIESGKPFHQFSYSSDSFDTIPKDTPNVSCSVCHDPHSAQSAYGLRSGSAGTACDTCHHEKWQNAVIEGKSGAFENGYHYPGEDYSDFLAAGNPHHTEDKCVLCHMSTASSGEDENNVRSIGGHTFRMRDFGPDDVPETGDDVLNIGVCQSCHPGVTDFDKSGMQTEIRELLSTLGGLLTGKNHDFLPANQPGKCARCHKGGTVPFIDDQDNVLENAYTNYKLILNDRSWGIHNPGYIKKLLEDSITSIQNDYSTSN